eukprot:scaffold44988_cov67-Phaeocystis_antarctica.AAC.7
MSAGLPWPLPFCSRSEPAGSTGVRGGGQSSGHASSVHGTRGIVHGVGYRWPSAPVSKSVLSSMSERQPPSSFKPATISPDRNSAKSCARWSVAPPIMIATTTTAPTVASGAAG